MEELKRNIEERMEEHFEKARDLRITGRSLKQSADGIRRGTDEHYKALEEIDKNNNQISRHLGSARAYQKVLEMLD